MIRRRLLITGAGTGPSNNLMRSLRAGDVPIFIVGCHDDRFYLGKSPAERNYLVPSPRHPDFANALRQIIRAEQIDLLIPTSDRDVLRVSALRAEVRCRTFLPKHSLIALCRDKYEFTSLLRARGVRVPRTYVVKDLASIETLFRRFPTGSPLWCRIRSGSGALGATPVTTPAQARNWIRYWIDVRRVSPASFTLSQYLPGRDFSCQSLWKDGTLIVAKTFENLSPFGPSGQPSVISSVAALAKTVREPKVADLCTQAIRRLDNRASGVYCFDVKEDSNGAPCLTDINAGRFSMSTNLYDLTGKHNMAAMYVRLALGQRINIHNEYDVAEGYYMVRDADTEPDVLHAQDFFQDIGDARGAVKAVNRSSTH
jgi:carbamoylphosphate synthase large subunit